MKKIEIVFGTVIHRPQLAVKLIVETPTRWQAFKWAAREQWNEVIFPALLFAVAVVAVRWSLGIL